jgi:DNA-binding response OmpR family regulator
MQVLVVEDNLLIADAIGDVLDKAGITVVGPVATLRHGLTVARSAPIDGAVLDIKLIDGHCFGIATILRLRQIPFVFLTGYDPEELIPEVFRSQRALQKPQGIWDLPMVAQADFAPH